MYDSWELWIFLIFCLVTLIQVFYYLYFFSRLAFYKISAKEKFQEHPVSVVVCARDEAENLSKNLPGVLVQTYRSSHEVVVVNDNSQDESKYFLEGLQKEFKHLQVIELKQEAKLIPGKKYPLSVGIKSAKYEVILLTDADCVPASEFWIQHMQEGFSEGIEIVLGYGAYEKRNGLLNKLIRFDTFHTALQYFSYALAGLPYMGVGRNLSYRKKLFFQLKGFSTHNHIPGGDDDLFINMAANSTNTAICINPESFTLSTPEEDFGGWIRQKMRHHSTGRFYKAKHRFLLGLYSLSHFLFFPLGILSMVFYNWKYALAVWLFRWLILGLVNFRTMKKLDVSDLWPACWFFDIWMFFYYIVLSPSIWKKPKASWK